MSKITVHISEKMKRKLLELIKQFTVEEDLHYIETDVKHTRIYCLPKEVENQNNANI